MADGAAPTPLSGRVALVTGASRGIGRGVASRLARDGATVVLAARDGDRLRTVAQEIRELGGTALDISADLADEVAVDRLFGAIDAGPGGPHILVNNASLVYGTERAFLDVDVGLWDEVVRANLRTLFLCTHRAANRMAGRATGVIVNISAASAQRAHRLTVPYDATKGAVDAFTRATALDLAPHGIRVNAVAPGPIVVEAWGDLPADELAKRAETVPLGRLGDPEDVAGLVAWLCTDQASYVTGQVIAVDGGLLAQLRSPQAEILPEVAWSR
jgi:3-oxoacyl-[acyl-carrier protein] reductase